MHTDAIQRLRIAYAVDGPLRYLSVLDMGRLWERLFRRAALPLAYTQGFNPHPRLAFAAPLPVGYSSQMERVDVYLGARLEIEQALGQLTPQSPIGLDIRGIEEIALQARPLQAIMRKADYAVDVWSEAASGEIEAALARIMGSDTLPWSKHRAGRISHFDLRALIIDASYASQRDGVHRLLVTMACSPQGAGRPEDLIAALQLPVDHFAICRTALHWAE